MAWSEIVLRALGLGMTVAVAAAVNAWPWFKTILSRLL